MCNIERRLFGDNTKYADEKMHLKLYSKAALVLKLEAYHTGG
jgi:hypothetical protein